MGWERLRATSREDRIAILVRWEWLKQRIPTGLTSVENAEFRALRRTVARLKSLQRRGE